ncbi:hypothetical protein Syun_026292 [Stephania yunnanensis]|uniref:Beta-Casp domain-containing protein n=1 Tax=Stephania yunnanensis TaxID=152371 RepID=A0AAP0EW45_9MAGN
MPPYVLTGPASLEFLPGVPSCLSAFVLVFPFAPSAITDGPVSEVLNTFLFLDAFELVGSWAPSEDNVDFFDFDRSFINASGPCVLFASPGMISRGFSLEVFKQWAPFEKNLIALLGQGGVEGDQRLRRSRGRSNGGGGELKRNRGGGAAPADERGGDQHRRHKGPRSGRIAGCGALSMASGGGSKKGQRWRFEKRGAAAAANSSTGGEDRAAAVAPEENTAQRQRQQHRPTTSIGQGHMATCGRRGLPMNN